MDLLLRNIGLLATPVGTSARKGTGQGEILLIPDATISVKDGKIAYAGAASSAEAPCDAEEILDCGGRLVTPGLVDAHTHLVFGGWRHKELSLKLAGVSYLDILKAGGGILSTVEHTRAASEKELFDKGKILLAEMLRLGVTTCEAKSGYGLSTADELKQLRVIRALDEAQAIDLVATFMGAHTVPNEYKENRDGFIDLVIEEMLPAVKKDQLAEFCDVFCETAVFTPQESRRILDAAARLGFGIKAHVDEIDPIGGAEMAAQAGALSAEHLIQTSEQGIHALAQSGVTAVLLPATSFYLDKPYARARAMIEAGVAVAVATDFNPGSSPGLSIQFAMNLACLKYKLTPAETLTAVTLNGAAAISRAEHCGSIEVGKLGDLVLWDAPDLDYICYRFGSNLARCVIKNGVIA